MRESEEIVVQFFVNDVAQSVKTTPFKRLLDVLRENLKLSGTKEGCGEGECGACTVVIDGELAVSCLVPMAQMQGTRIMTIESVAAQGKLSRLQSKMAQLGGTQCGICTPGIVLACEVLIRKNKNPHVDEIKEAIAGNICRCTGYTRILDAVTEACSGSTS